VLCDQVCAASAHLIAQHARRQETPS